MENLNREKSRARHLVRPGSLRRLATDGLELKRLDSLRAHGSALLVFVRGAALALEGPHRVDEAACRHPVVSDLVRGSSYQAADSLEQDRNDQHGDRVADNQGSLCRSLRQSGSRSAHGGRDSRLVAMEP